MLSLSLPSSHRSRSCRIVSKIKNFGRSKYILFLFFAVGTSGRPALKYELSSRILKFKACGPVNGQKSFLMISGSFDDCKKKEEVFIVLGLIF